MIKIDQSKQLRITLSSLPSCNEQLSSRKKVVLKQVGRSNPFKATDTLERVIDYAIYSQRRFREHTIPDSHA